MKQLHGFERKGFLQGFDDLAPEQRRVERGHDVVAQVLQHVAVVHPVADEQPGRGCRSMAERMGWNRNIAKRMKRISSTGISMPRLAVIICLPYPVDLQVNADEHGRGEGENQSAPDDDPDVEELVPDDGPGDGPGSDQKRESGQEELQSPRNRQDVQPRKQEGDRIQADARADPPQHETRPVFSAGRPSGPGGSSVISTMAAMM